jgi:hypothetical protein
MKKNSIIVALFAFALTSCSKGTISTVVEKPVVTTTQNRDVSGATLYAQECTKCHGFEPREKYTAEQWKRIVPDMARKAGIDSNQEAIILKYVLEAAKP